MSWNTIFFTAYEVGCNQYGVFLLEVGMSRAVLQAKLERVKKRLDLYYGAEEAILSGAQSYTIGSRTLTRADLDAIRKVITALETDLSELESAVAGKGFRKCVRALPRDI